MPKARNYALILAVSLATLSGCGDSATKKHHLTQGHEFAPNGTPRAVDRIADAQIASGARAEATLYPQHFDRGELNSLGRKKLQYMMQDDDAYPMVIYIDVPKSVGGPDAAGNRQKAITAFLKDQGLTQSQFELRDGANPDFTRPAIVNTKAAAPEGNEAAGNVMGLSAGNANK